MASLTPYQRLKFKAIGWWYLHIWYYIYPPIYDFGYRVWHWIGKKCDWLELVYWELENE